MMAMREIFPGVYFIEVEGEERLATRNLVPGKRVYGERLVNIDGVEYRLRIASRSKLAAAILNGLEEMPILPGSRVLYLGVASGTTASHVSDIVGYEGIVFGVDVAHRMLRELLYIAMDRKNLVPILADATKPRSYTTIVGMPVDVLYADVAHPAQSQIVCDNAKVYLKPEGHLLMAIKARSIDSAAEPEVVFKSEIEKLKKCGFKPLQVINLEPYHKDHVMVHAVYKG